MSMFCNVDLTRQLCGVIRLRKRAAPTQNMLLIEAGELNPQTLLIRFLDQKIDDT
jgi:hypothetical protein